MIEGYFGARTGRAYLDARIVIPRLAIVEDIIMAIDTGADRTALMPVDCRAFGIDTVALSDPAEMIGVGGATLSYTEDAWVAFENGDNYAAYAVRLSIVRVGSNDPLLPIPSLVGRNILRHWRIEYDQGANLLQCHPRFSDVASPRTSSIQPPVRWLD